MSRFGEELYHGLARAFLLAAGLVVLLWFVHQIRLALLVLVLAIVIALALNAPVTWMEARKVPRPLAVLAVFIALLAVVAGLGWLVVPRLVREIPRFLDEIPQIVAGLAERVTEAFGDHPEVERQISNVVDMVIGAIGGLWQHAAGLVGAFLMVIVVLALVLFMIATPRPLLEGYLRALPPHLREPGARALARSAKMVVAWVGANVVLGGIKAGASFIFLVFMGVPGAVIWAVLGLFSALVPRVGFYVMALPPTLMALSVDFQTALWVALFYWALSEFLGAVVAPHVQGEAMEIHPAFLLFMAIAMALAFGLVGVLISAPVAGFLKAYFEEFYVCRRPEDPDRDERVRAILERRVRAAEG